MHRITNPAKFKITHKISTLSLLITIGVILLGCNNFEDKSKNIYVGEVINEELNNKLKVLGLIDDNDTILGLWHTFIDEPNQKSENYTFFTYDNFVQYYNSENKEPIITNIPIDSILDIRKNIDAANSNKISIKIKHFKGLSFNERNQKDEIFYVDYSFFPPYDVDITQQKQFYELLLETWKNNSKHEELIAIYSRFYDKDGNQLISNERERARNELVLLQKEIEGLSVNIINKDDFIVVYLDKTIFLFRYGHINEEFTVFNINVEDKIEDDMNAMTILSIYPIHKHGEIELPFTDKGFTVNSANRYNEKSAKKIADNHFR